MSDLRELGDISLPFALDKKGNYIYIKDADRGTKYYCPCCNKEVNTIAIDEGVDYKMPPHYRHYPNQSCTGESLAHWVYKMWLFDKDSQFNVYNGTDKISYTVETIDIEKTYSTDYGDYRPDISITTTCGKVFFFELNFSNPKRSDDYFCKWSQLNNDVIEVNVKKLLKESLNNKVPTFRLIYSEGVCFDDKYNKRDAFANAANKLFARKLEVKRQDMLNYKTVWERLDWFFDSIKMYKAMKLTIDDVFNSFRNVPYEEMELCFNIVKNISCIDNNDGFRNIINETFEEYICNLLLLYNDRYTGIARFNISKDRIRKTLWNVECFTESKVGILGYSIHTLKDTLSWKRYFYPFSLYNDFKNMLAAICEKLIQHMSQVLIINENTLSKTNEIDIEYYKSLLNPKIINKKYDFIKLNTNIDNMIIINVKDINSYRYEKNIKKLTETKYRFNEENEIYDENDYSIVCKYSSRINECNQIDSIKFRFGSSSLENYLLKFVSLSEFYINGVNEVNTFLNLNSDDRYEKLVKMIDGVNIGKNMMDIKAVEIISDIRKKFSHHDYLDIKINCENAHVLKFKMIIKMNHGTYYSKDYSEYSGEIIVLKNGIIDDTDITNMEFLDIQKIIYDKLIKSKYVAINKLNKFDGINKNSRLICIKGDK